MTTGKTHNAGSLHALVRRLPPGCRALVRMLQSGHRLYWGNFGAWTQDPIDAKCRNVHLSTARALVRRRVVVRGTGLELVMSPNK